MAIMGYKTFNSENEFIAWQKEEDRKIYQVSPVVFSLGADVSNNKSVEATVGVGCFVLYEKDG